MFTQPCIIKKNTPELIAYLIGLGYIQSFSSRNDIGSYLRARRKSYYATISEPESKDELIDCGENEELFMAISALRGDSDIMQWFTDGSHFKLCNSIEFGKIIQDYQIPTETGWKVDVKSVWKKATVSELIEHFKD